MGAERVLVGGDDALELVHRLSPNGASGDAIGVGLRRSAYSGVTDETARTVGRVVQDAAARHGSKLRLVPVSLYPDEADAHSFADILGRDGDEVTTPAQAVRQAGACRVVVAGSYHAAVFALAQGVPVVALSGAPYYDAKLAGLADLFPGGCRVVPAHDGELGPRLAAALDESWETADALAPELVAAAGRQIAASREAYARFSDPVSRRLGAAVRPQPPAGLSVSHSTESSESAKRYLYCWAARAELEPLVAALDGGLDCRDQNLNRRPAGRPAVVEPAQPVGARPARPGEQVRADGGALHVDREQP